MADLVSRVIEGFERVRDQFNALVPRLTPAPPSDAASKDYVLALKAGVAVWILATALGGSTGGGTTEPEPGDGGGTTNPPQTVATYLGPVTNAARVPNATITDSYARSITQHIVRGPNPGYVQPVYVGFFDTGNAIGNAQTITLKVTDTAGVTRTATYGGQSSGTIPDGGAAIPDKITGTYTDGGTITIDVQISVAAGGKIAVKDFPKASGDKFSAGSSPVADGFADFTGFAIYPMMVLGPTDRPTVAIFGDSRSEKYFDTQDSTRDIGSTERWVGANFAYANFSIGGRKALDFTGSTNCARPLAKYCSHGVIEAGINDLGYGDTEAQLRARVLQIPTNFSDIPAWILQTMTPETESSDGWKTTTNQRAGSTTTATLGPRFFSIDGDDDRKINNRWRRSKPSPFVGFVDTAAVVQTAGSNGIEGGAWLAPSGVPYTGDGVHELPVALIAMRDQLKDSSAATLNATLIAPNTLAEGGSTTPVPSKTGTTTVLSSSKNPSTAGTNITLTATIIPSSGSATPTGTVTFKDGSTTLGTGAVGSNGKATLATSALSQATHSLTAVYGGDSTFSGSTSSALSQVVQAGANPGTGSGATTLSRHHYYDRTTMAAVGGAAWADGVEVLTVEDQGPNGYTETTGGTGNRPTYIAGSMNGKSAIRFAEAQWLFSDATPTPGPAAWLFLLKPNQRGADFALVSSHARGGVEVRIDGNGGLGIINTVQADVYHSAGGIIPDKTPVLLVLMFNPETGAIRVRVNGLDVATGNRVYTDFTQGLKTVVGANGYFVNNGGPLEGYAGDMLAKVVMLAPTLAQVQAEEAIYAQVAGITLP